MSAPPTRFASVPAPVRALGVHLRASALYFAVWAALTWPLLADPDHQGLTTRFGWSHLWVMEWLHDEWQAAPGRIPWYSWVRGYPGGGVVVLIGWPMVLAYQAVRLVLPEVAAFNVLLVGFAALAGYAAWGLLRRLGASEAGALVGGLVYSASPYALSLARIGEVPNLCHAFLPLTLWALDAAAGNRAAGVEGPARWGEAVGRWIAAPAAAVAWLGLTSATPYYGILSVPVVAGFAAWRGGVALARPVGGTVSGRRAWVARLGTLVRGAGCAALVGLGAKALVAYFSLLQGVSVASLLFRPATGAIGVQGARPTWLFMEATLDALVTPGRIPLDAASRDAIQVAYLGLVPLGAAVVALTRPRWSTLFWLLAGAASVSLMLGDVLIVHGAPYRTSAGMELRMPLGLLKDAVPMLRTVYVPYRAAIGATLCLGGLAAAAVDRFGPRARPWVASALGALLLVELVTWSPTPWPLPVERPVGQELFRELGEEDADYAVLPFPFECAPGQAIGRYSGYFVDEALHGKRVGWVDRYLPDRTKEAMGKPQPLDQPFLRSLCGLLNPRPTAPLPGDDDASWFGAVGFRWLILHDELLADGQREAVHAWIEARLGPPDPRSQPPILLYRLGDGTVDRAALSATPPVRALEPRWLFRVGR